MISAVTRPSSATLQNRMCRQARRSFPCLARRHRSQRDGRALDVIGRPRAPPRVPLEGLRLRRGDEQRPAARNNRDAMAAIWAVSSQPELHFGKS